MPNFEKGGRNDAYFKFVSQWQSNKSSPKSYELLPVQWRLVPQANKYYGIRYFIIMHKVTRYFSVFSPKLFLSVILLVPLEFVFLCYFQFFMQFKSLIQFEAFFYLVLYLFIYLIVFII